jgi:hypothetical protein
VIKNRLDNYLIPNFTLSVLLEIFTCEKCINQCENGSQVRITWKKSNVCMSRVYMLAMPTTNQDEKKWRQNMWKVNKKMKKQKTRKP